MNEKLTYASLRGSNYHASVIQYPLPHRAEPPIFIHQLIDYKLTVLRITQI